MHITTAKSLLYETGRKHS